VAGPQYCELRPAGSSGSPGARRDTGAASHGGTRSGSIAAGGAPLRGSTCARWVGGVPAGESVVADNEIPYRPWALAQKKENAAHWLERDPEIRCFMPGVPRATYMPYPFQILQSADVVLIGYEFAGTTRTIHLKEVKNNPAPTWMGLSRGRWEGETLVVDVTDFNDQTWFDRAGNFHSDALHVVERYTPVSPYHLMYEATIEDPKVFTRPWKISMPLYRRFEPAKRILEYKCTEFVEQLLYGRLGVVDPATRQINQPRSSAR
jgi:hypothetical protein